MSASAKKIEYDNPGTIMAVVAGGIADLIGMFSVIGLIFPPLLGMALPAVIAHYIAAVFIFGLILRNMKHLVPKIVLWLALVVPFPVLLLGTIIALILQNRIIEFAVTQAAIVAVGVATAGVGAAAGEAAAGAGAVAEAGAVAAEAGAATAEAGAAAGAGAVAEAGAGAARAGAAAAEGAGEVAEGAAKEGAGSLGERFGGWVKEEAKEYARGKVEEKIRGGFEDENEEPTLDELLYEGAPPGTLEETERSLRDYNPLENMTDFDTGQKKDEDVTLEDDGTVNLGTKKGP